jgi:predicted alpha/beta-hydrolase family hydrolase
MLFVQGSRDTFGTREELGPIVDGLAEHTRGTRMLVVEGGDHSLVRPKSAGETIDQVIVRVAGEIARFIG